MNTVVLHVTYNCKPGQAQAFVSAIRQQGLQAKVQTEDGCMQYDYHLSLEKEDTVVLLEQWRSADALACHLAQPHMAQIRAIKEQFVDDVTVERFE